MDTKEMLRIIEAEITKLQRAASALRGVNTDRQTRHQARKRPKLSAAARARIAAAQRKRWAKVKAAKKSA